MKRLMPIYHTGMETRVNPKPESLLNSEPVITHRHYFTEFEKDFAAIVTRECSSSRLRLLQ